MTQRKPQTLRCKNCGGRGWVAHDMMASSASACTECNTQYKTIQTQWGVWYTLKPNRRHRKAA